ncbi:MAG: transporter substrate-binding domain-containing protein [Acidobacteria bacterium]|nr:transporter substrate-binding domain-containing protein [Acidobacteriota bacterium]
MRAVGSGGGRRCRGAPVPVPSWVAMLALAVIVPPAAPAPLDAIRERGAVALCANPESLPWASKEGAVPGFQVEIARAIAGRLGVALQVDWIVPRRAARAVDCDLQLDVAARQGVEHPGLRLSVPYQTNSVVLAIAPGHDDIASLEDLRRGGRVAVATNSIASRLVDQQGIAFRPFFDDEEVMQATTRGECAAGAVSRAALEYYNATHPKEHLRSLPLVSLSPDLQWPVAVGLRRADEALEAAVNDALRTMLADGTLAGIYARYGIALRVPAGAPGGGP